MTLGTEKHCELLSNQIRDKSTAMYDGFKLFIQMFSGIAGGSALARLQYGDKIPARYIWLSNALVVLIAVTAVIVIVDHYRSWYGYRQALTKTAGKNAGGHHIVPAPSHYLSARTIVTMISVVIIASGIFIAFNPLQISN